MIIIELFSRQKPIMRIFRLGASNQRNTSQMVVQLKMQTYTILQDIWGFTSTKNLFSVSSMF